MAESQWPASLVKQLIKSYKDKPMLWQATHPMYRVSTVKYEAWNEMAREFDCDIVDIRRKLSSLHASHRREKAKIRFGGRSTWFLYKHLSFLPGHLPMAPDSPTRHHDNVKTNSKSESETYSKESENSDHEYHDSDTDAFDDVIQEIIIKDEPVVEHIETKRYKPKNHQTNRLRRTVKKVVKSDRKSNKVNNKLIEAVKLLTHVDSPRRRDECDSFGEYIAESLRRHDDRTQSMIKQAINNILFEQEMKKYNTTSTCALVVNGLDENPLKLSVDDDK